MQYVPHCIGALDEKYVYSGKALINEKTSTENNTFAILVASAPIYDEGYYSKIMFLN